MVFFFKNRFCSDKRTLERMKRQGTGKSTHKAVWIWCRQQESWATSHRRKAPEGLLYNGGNWGSKNKRDLPEATQQESLGGRSKLQIIIMTNILLFFITSTTTTTIVRRFNQGLSTVPCSFVAQNFPKNPMRKKLFLLHLNTNGVPQI